MFVKKINYAKEIYSKVFSDLDVSRLADVYDSNGEILLEGGIIVKGIEDITKKTKRFIELIGPSHVELQNLDFWEHGDVIYEQGTFLLKNKKSGKAFHSGFYMIIWKIQRDGAYKIYREMKMDEMG